MARARRWLNRGMFSNSRHVVDETVDLTLAYIREETIGPLRGAGRWLGVGLVASVAIVIGTVLSVLGVLRLTQDLLAPLGSSWSSVPYFVAGIFSIVWTMVVLSRIDRDRLN